VMPNNASPMDVQVNGTILESNGEAMMIRVQVVDSVGPRVVHKRIRRGHQPV
jgi:hypothetical protein